jgi:hypothetical protein
MKSSLPLYVSDYMPTDADKWTQFNIRVYSDPWAADARRILFELRGQKSHPATVVLRAGGELLVKFLPPEPEVPGFTRDDFVLKAAAMVRWMDRATRPSNPT